MILLDASFVIAWLLGEARAARLPVHAHLLGILPAQYCEVLVHFLRRGVSRAHLLAQLTPIDRLAPQEDELQDAAERYLTARRQQSKASLADAIMVATACARQLPVASFDADLQDLGLTLQDTLWRGNAGHHP
ncbi:MAG: PIN domain-containing protein [Polyangiales bacterium]